MKIFMDETFGKVWTDESLPAIFTIIKRPVNKAEFEILAKKQLSCVIQLSRSYNRLFSVTDLLECENWTKNDAIQYVGEIVEREFKLGLHHKFFVRSKNKETKDALIHGLVACANLNMHVVDSFEEALKEITAAKITQVKPSLISRTYRRIFQFPKILKSFLELKYQRI